MRRKAGPRPSWLMYAAGAGFLAGVAVTAAMLGAGTSKKHCRLNAPGHVSAGGVVSLTVNTCEQVLEFPHASTPW